MLLFDGNKPTTKGDETLAGDLVDKLGATRAAIKLLQGEEHALEDWLVHVAAPAGATPGEAYIANGEDYSAEITLAPEPNRRRNDDKRPRVTLAPEPSGGLDYLTRAPERRPRGFGPLVGAFAVGFAVGYPITPHHEIMPMLVAGCCFVAAVILLLAPHWHSVRENPPA